MPSREVEIAESATAFVSAALETWLVKGDTVALAEYYADQTAYVARLEKQGLSDRDPSVALTKHFALALVEDGNRTTKQTQIASAMTVTRTFGADGSSRISALKLPEVQPQGENPVPSFVAYDSLSAALLPISDKGDLFQIVQLDCHSDPKDTCAVAVAVLRDRAPEYLILELRKLKRKRWKIVGDYSLDPY